MHNLAINDLTEKSSSAILFEPSELIDFQIAWDWQKKWQVSLMSDPSCSQAVWILEHFDCYTLGRGASEKNLLFDIYNPPSPLYRIDRGGEVTHHAPGQLVIYLVMNLQLYKKDLNWYLRELESVLIDVLKSLGLHGYKLNDMTGVWCEGQKVASIGIGCRRWITLHGMALNVNCDLEGFHQIVPCGVDGLKTGRLSQWIPDVEIKEVTSLMKKSLNKHFGLLWRC